MTQSTIDLTDIPAPTFDGADAAPAEEKPKRRRTRKTATPATGPAEGRPDRAPRQSRTRKTATAKQVQDAATGLHQLAGSLVLPMVGKPHTGAAVASVAEDAGKLWAELAARYPLIGRLFTSGDTGAVMVQLLMIYAPIVQLAMAEGKQAADAAKAKAGPADYPKPYPTPTPADVFGPDRR